MKNIKYRSRISIFLTLLIVALLIPSILPALKSDAFVAIAVSSLAPIFIIFCFASTKYIIIDEKLIVKTLGIKMADINIANIRSIERSYNPLSSPAGSLKRLKVSFYSKGHKQLILISPVREQEFIEQLRCINPNITTRIKDKRGVLRFWDWDF